ncbi:arsenate reductase/protein-tyrosine-phosphatase family protein [Demequina salsinemoris]|uniref:arsenate reductase/protein-tyrosine-phosphatase family protein n=1 Tax=Demequina salsinemoris TaxID=577470 RepID=UPI000785A5EE|nr:hypothetical protein [Demequina salsinemoris]
MPARPQSAFRILIVDTHDTGRAPVSERLLRRALAEHGIPADQIRVTSAGLDAVDGARITDTAARLIVAHGGNADGFVARSLSAQLVGAADLLLAPTAAERDEVARRHPRAARRVFTWAELKSLYGDVVELAAPLHEHPLILARNRAVHPVPVELELTAWTSDAEADAAGEWIAAGVHDAAERWSALVDRDVTARAPHASSCVLDAFGTRIGITCSGAGRDDLSREVLRVWSRCIVPSGRDNDAEIEVCVDPDPQALAEARARGALAFADVPQALHHLSSAVTVRAIDRHAGNFVMLHAAAVASRDGDVIGFIAPSGTGKTTLSRVLGAHHGYVTDETLAIAGDRVYAYPKPLSVITESHQGIKLQWSPDSLDLAVPPADLRLSRLVLLDRRPDGPVSPVLEDVPHLRGIAELAEQTSYLPRLSRMLHTLSDTVDSVGGLTRLSYREASTVLTVMPELWGAA